MSLWSTVPLTLDQHAHKSTLLNFCPLAKPETRSSVRGNGCCSSVKRVHSDFIITTDSWSLIFLHCWNAGHSHSLVLMGSSTPLFTNLSNSASAWGLIAYETGLALRRFGMLPGLTVSTAGPIFLFFCASRYLDVVLLSICGPNTVLFFLRSHQSPPNTAAPSSGPAPVSATQQELA